MMHNAAGMQRPTGAVKVKSIPTAEDEAEASTYRLPDGQLYLPATAAHSSLIEGGSGRKVGKFGAKILLGSTVFVTHPECPLVDPETREALHEYRIDQRRVVVQHQGVVRARARIDNWQADVTFEYDQERIVPAIIGELFSIAGRGIGLLEYRPKPKMGKPGPFGRYNVELVATKD